jgi:hypothetical protein
MWESGGSVLRITEEMAVMGFFFAIAAGCLIAAVVVGYRQGRKGDETFLHWLTHPALPSRSSAFFWILQVFICAHWLLPTTTRASVPAALFVAGPTLAVALAVLAMTVLAISYSFKPGWNRHVALRQTVSLIMASILCAFVLSDVFLYLSKSWIWIIAGLEAAFLTPLFARLAYLEYYQRYVEPPAEPEKESGLILPPF